MKAHAQAGVTRVGSPDRAAPESRRWPKTTENAFLSLLSRWTLFSGNPREQRAWIFRQGYRGIADARPAGMMPSGAEAGQARADPSCHVDRGLFPGVEPVALVPVEGYLRFICCETCDQVDCRVFLDIPEGSSCADDAGVNETLIPASIEELVIPSFCRYRPLLLHNSNGVIDDARPLDEVVEAVLRAVPCVHPLRRTRREMWHNVPAAMNPVPHAWCVDPPTMLPAARHPLPCLCRSAGAPLRRGGARHLPDPP